MPNDDHDEVKASLLLSERRRKEAQRLSGVGFWELNHKEQTLYWSEEIFKIYGIDPNAFEPNYEIFASLIFDEDREMVEHAYLSSVEKGTEYRIRYRIKYGAGARWIEANGVTYYDEDANPERSIGTARDLSEIVAAQTQNEFLATHDVLTGLPNRHLFSELIEKEMSAAKRKSARLAIIFIDIDDFKKINDRYGHEIGDQVIKEIAKNLSARTKPDDNFARFGGDEFIGLMPFTENVEIDKSLNQLKKIIEGTYDTNVGPLKIKASIGVAVFPDDNDNVDALIRQADHAMYEAKEEGRSRIRYFDRHIHYSNITRFQLLQDIEHAIANEAFQLYYQPRVSLVTGKLEGVETLLRWFRDHESFPPCRIIEAISRTPLEWKLDMLVFRTVLSELVALRESYPELSVSINFNQTTVENPMLPQHLKRLLAANEQEAQGLEIEILEVASIRELKITNQILQKCRRLGFTTSLDDFGTGYSSLSYFHGLPIDILKIDRGFVKNLLHDKHNLAVVKSILALAKANNRPVVAEGIEVMDDANTLSKLGCDTGQGFGIAHPMPLSQFQSWSKEWDPKKFLRSLRGY